MFGIGMQELMIIAFIMLLLFGSRLPGVMRSMGQSIKAFQDGVKEGTTDVPA